ncbi:Helix-turn-helix domain-containing protein [Chromobacterium vaccinii]|nr:Helix-turn-helix domain-containing protein [Chromobacterium vaccinii]QND88650.1 Helix-turn-helix domain-containing protein [Chromobacterium vaccinii]
MENKNARTAEAVTSANTNPNISDTSVEAQCFRLLNALKIGPVTTFEARTRLNILHPAGRIADLRGAGNSIGTERVTITDENGHKHSGIARYTLLSECQSQEDAA